ncbi:glutaredoxin domain containing protein [Grosmannia clavigera kw1407]|uniref:Glutaredoxin domain containing protein n=1 Tax=Grosmannia clavigera (strain kw1407 / UAMH 11150) TaxID=655863 RepID=F0XRN4_GROCL|nr:glutaredoxin domain containing protein [Grosmannia clavigera kw1407]EFW99628.1 glutaredoxin domain containing protein [Grosmannia clavigera kw1407]
MARRIKLLFLGVMAFTISILLYSSRLRQSHTPDQRTIQDFYHKTKSALDKLSPLDTLGTSVNGEKGAPVVVDMDADGDIDEDDVRLAREMADRLRAAEQQAKDLANAKSPNKPDLPSNLVGVGSSASGQKQEVAESSEGTESETEHAAEEELDIIIKKAPVIIFSKTYCPYSKRAKGLLLDKYSIDPAPFVVELDIHPLGAALQARLGKLTGRRTVPNILVGGKSIGGGDDIAELDRKKALVDRVKSLAGNGLEMKERLSA